jgi:hypothetical protein
VVTPHPLPRVLQALHAAAEAAAEADLAAGGDRVRVDLGPAGEFEERDAIGIGVTVDALGEAVRVEVGPTPARETYRISVGCVAQSWAGDGDFTARIVRGCQLVDLVREQLNLDAQLGLPGVVLRSYISQEGLTPIGGAEGAIALTSFTVTVEAYRSRR